MILSIDRAAYRTDYLGHIIIRDTRFTFTAKTSNPLHFDALINPFRRLNEEHHPLSFRRNMGWYYAWVARLNLRYTDRDYIRDLIQQTNFGDCTPCVLRYFEHYLHQ